MERFKKVTIKRPAPYVNVYKGTKIVHRYAIPQGDIYEATYKGAKGGCPVCLKGQDNRSFVGMRDGKPWQFFYCSRCGRYHKAT